MLRWTLKSMLAAPLALIASISAAAGALLLVMLFEAVFAGESEKIVAYLHKADADVWVMQSGVSNMHMATSYLADWKVAEIRDVPGVAAADPILYLGTTLQIGARRWFTYIVGLDVPSRQAGPWAMAAGSAQPGPGEAVLPAIFAAMTGLGLGDTVRIIDRDFTIVGLSEETFSMANSLIFVTRPDLEDIMTSLNIVSFILVKVQDGADPATVAADIERRVDKVSALPTAQFVANDRRLVMQMGVETIALMTFIGGALAMLLVAFAIYSQVARQRQELAVVKALGATNRSLYASIAFQAAAITGVSVALAALLAAVLMPWITALIPQVSLQLTATAVARVAVIGFAVALLASLLPARQIARVDPLSAFRGTS
jgi:putative ABC transport system permease protein